MAGIGWLGLRWAVLIADLEPVEGHEQGGQRRVLVVSYEPFHQKGMASICPITAARSEVRWPGEIAIGIGEAGQTKAGVILCHQVRTISLERIAGSIQGYVTDQVVRAGVREKLAIQLGLNAPGLEDGSSNDDFFEVR